MSNVSQATAEAPVITPDITLHAVRAAMRRARANGLETFHLADFRIHVGERTYTGKVAEDALSVLIGAGRVEALPGGRYRLVPQKQWVRV